MSSTVPLHLRPKPRLRGRLHEVAFIVAIPAGLVLLFIAPGPVGKIACAIYWVALLSQFGVSATYHIGKWGERAHSWLRRLDHSAIFLLIAGTYTPFCLLALDGTASRVLLAVVWLGAIAGIITKLWRADLNVLSGILYLGLGWAAIWLLPTLVHVLTPIELGLVIAGECSTPSARSCWRRSGPTPSRRRSGSTRSGTRRRSRRPSACSSRSRCSAWRNGHPADRPARR
jgi:hemolysin III